MGEKSNPFLQVYFKLLDHYGQQDWWPADDCFEIMIGAILTQNTNWQNVEKAINSLKQTNSCSPQALFGVSVDALAQMIRSSGYFNQKAQRLKHFTEWYLASGGYDSLARLEPVDLRSRLLALKGIGEETADDICLYAFEHPWFVVDSYTRRIFSRLKLLNGSEKYGEIQQAFHAHLQADSELFQQYHALIVEHAKQHCRKQPQCEHCPLIDICHYD